MDRIRAFYISSKKSFLCSWFPHQTPDKWSLMVEDVNKLMKLSEIGRMIKVKIKQDGCCVDGEPRNLEVWGNVDRGIWDQEATSLDMLRDQGHGKKGKIYYDFD